MAARSRSVCGRSSERMKLQPLLQAGAAVVALVLGMTSSAAARKGADEVRLNQIQVIGTHNSYHAGLAPGVKQWLEMKRPEAVAGLDYRHAPLDQQLSAGIRQFEIDIYSDSKGGRFAHPKAVDWVAAAGLTLGASGDSADLMAKPGFKVLHVQDVDYRSTCQPLIGCLRIIRDWSRQHPEHAPLFILIETKTERPPADVELAEPEAFTSQRFDELDAEIRSVFAPEALITPDQVRGPFATLNAAIRAGHWPTLRAARGKVLFLLDQARARPAYLEGHPSLRGRVLFTNAVPGEPDAAFVEQNENDVDAINALVREGYLVRARTDWDTRQARANDTSRRDALLSSGAQLLSTDYPASEPASWTGYSVGFPEKRAARCNPLIAPPSCRSEALDPTEIYIPNR